MHAGKQRSFQWHADGAAWSEVSVIRLRHTALTVTDLSPDVEGFSCFDVLGGGYRYEHNGDDFRLAAGDAGLFTNDGGVRVSVAPHIDHRALRVSQRIMNDVACLSAGESVSFTGTMPINETAYRRFHAVGEFAARLAEDVVEDEDVVLIVDNLARLVASTMLNTFANSALAHDPNRTDHAGCKSVSRALEYIRAHFLGPITVNEIAEAARVTPRALNDLFQKRFSMPPMSYVRRERMSWAHEQLKQGDPSTLLIGAIARKTGYASTPKFSARYREVYGMLPSETLRRSKG